jgi:hypothetical protein
VLSTFECVHATLTVSLSLSLCVKTFRDDYLNRAKRLYGLLLTMYGIKLLKDLYPLTVLVRIWNKCKIRFLVGGNFKRGMLEFFFFFFFFMLLKCFYEKK